MSKVPKLEPPMKLLSPAINKIKKTATLTTNEI